MDTSMSRKEFCYNCLAESRRRLMMAFNWEEISTFASLVIRPRLRVSSWSTSASSFRGPSTVVEEQAMLLVWQRVCAGMLRLVNFASKLELWCWLIMEFAASMNSTRWISKIKLLSMKLWSSRPSQSRKQESMRHSTLVPQSLQLLIQDGADMTRPRLSVSTSISHRLSCLVSISSSSFLMRRMMKKIWKSLSI